MRRSDIQLSRPHLWLVYGGTALLIFSGLLWWLLERFGQVEGEFGPVKNPWQHPLLVAHGLAALAYLILLGSLTTLHIRRGWAVRKQRLQASFLFAGQSILVLTAGGLYYVGHEGTRALISTTHLVTGVLLAGMLPLHIWLGRRAKKKVNKTDLHKV